LRIAETSAAITPLSAVGSFLAEAAPALFAFGDIVLPIDAKPRGPAIGLAGHASAAASALGVGFAEALNVGVVGGSVGQRATHLSA
jgi:hypothetical protein